MTQTLAAAADALDLEPIAARLAAATKGPWTLNDTHAPAVRFIYDADGCLVETFYGGKPNAEFIAHSRADIEAMHDEIVRLRRERYDLAEIAMTERHEIDRLTARIAELERGR